MQSQDWAVAPLTIVYFGEILYNRHTENNHNDRGLVHCWTERTVPRHAFRRK